MLVISDKTTEKIEINFEISEKKKQRTKTVEFSLAGGLLYAREAAELVRRLSE